MLIPIYYFDDEKYFAYEGQAQKLGDGSILMPDDATQVAPDAEKLATHFAKWNEAAKKWEYEAKPKSAADFVGRRISHKSQSAHDIEMRQLKSFERKSCLNLILLLSLGTKMAQR